MSRLHRSASVAELPDSTADGTELPDSAELPDGTVDGDVPDHVPDCGVPDDDASDGDIHGGDVPGTVPSFAATTDIPGRPAPLPPGCRRGSHRPVLRCSCPVEPLSCRSVRGGAIPATCVFRVPGLHPADGWQHPTTQ